MGSFNKAYVSLIVFCSSLGMMAYAYIQVIPSAVLGYLQNHIFPGITVTRLSLIASIMLVGGMFGCLSSDFLLSWVGRRRTLLLGDFIAILGTVLTAFANYGSIIAGRLIQGYICGINTCIAPLYFLESIPVESKGIAGIASMILFASIIVFAQALGFAVPKDLADGETSNVWRVCHLLALIFPVIRIILFLTVVKHETPVYLIQHHKNEEALAALQKVYRDQAQEELNKMIKDSEPVKSQVAKKPKIMQVFEPKYRKVFLIGSLIASIQCLTGNNAVFTYSSFIFAGGKDVQADDTTAVLSLMVTVIHLVFICVSILTVDKLGRRRQYLMGLTGMGIVMLTYAIIVSVDNADNTGAKVMLLIWPGVFAMSLGGLTFLYLGEVLPDFMMGYVLTLNWTFGFILSQVFLDVVEAIGLAAVFYIFTGIAVFGLVILMKFMVESHGKTKTEILNLYRKVPEIEDTQANAQTNLES